MKRGDASFEALPRRVRATAVVLTVAAVGWLLFQGDSRSAIVLTAGALGSIVAFRGLEAQVAALEPRRDGSLGLPNVLRIVVRFMFLAIFVLAATLLGARDFAALIAGLSVLPLSLMIQGLAWVLRARTNR